MRKFNPGDVVVLNSSDSPKMTVAKYFAQENLVSCQWFHEGKIQEANLYETSIKPWESNNLTQ